MEDGGGVDHGAGGGGGGGEGGGGGDMRLLLSILADGEEQARRLVGDALDDDGGRAEECCCCRERAGVARQLWRALGKAVAVAKAIEAAGGGSASGSRGTDVHHSESPRSADESSGATLARVHGVCKRRKGLPRWTQKFRMPDTSLEYTPEDGFSWRKYGQKDILGAKFPRAYYRCTYRSAQGCPATRQVQRSDNDVAVFDVTYQGEHACHQQHRRHGDDRPLLPDQDVQLLASFKNGLKVETDGGVMAAASVPARSSFHGVHASSSMPDFSFDLTSAPPSFPDVVAPGFSPVGSGQQVLPAFSVSAPGSSYFSVSAPGHSPAVDTRGGADPPPTELGDVVPAATTAPPATVDPAAVRFDYSMYQFHAELDDPQLPFPPTAFHHHYFGEW